LSGFADDSQEECLTAENGLREESDTMMDLGYWGFRHWPFDRTFASDRFFASPLHDEAMSRLLFLVEEKRRCGIITGAKGTGKTFLMKLIGQRSERLGRLVVRCDSTGLDCDELMTQAAMACHVGCDPNAGSSKIWNGLRARFTALAVIQQPVVLLIDHFDSSEKGCRQAVRRLNQLADLVGLKLTIILATGESKIPIELQELVELRIDLAPWTVQETSQFIRMAIERAGGQKRLFTNDAIEAVHEVSLGVPAKIVSLGNLCLLATLGQNETLVTSDIVQAVAIELFPGNVSSKPRIPADVSSTKRNGQRVAL
jgi:general secretion pathway protein A